MAKRSKTASKDKPEKPHPDFPLFPHAAGVWAKKVRGNLHYFGPWSDPDKALEKWLDEKDDLLAGRKPRQRGVAGVTVRDLCNHYLTHQSRKLEAGEISPVSFKDRNRATDRIVAAFGRERIVSDLRPEDFGILRATLAKKLGPLALGIEIQRIKSVFRYGVDSGLCDAAVRYGQSFDKPSRKVLRADRQTRGPKLFAAAELRKIIAAAPAQLKAMTLLGINAGMGNRDVALLPLKAVDLAAGWIDYPRPKTAIPRRVPLWPETVKALRAVIDKRRPPKNDADAGLLFVTRQGRCWVKQSEAEKGAWTDSVGLAFGKLLRKLDLKRDGCNFYALRHTFQTVADECRDEPAVSAIMGHSADASDMAAVYRERISDERLQAVGVVVRKWLFPKAAKESGTVDKSKAKRKKPRPPVVTEEASA